MHDERAGDARGEIERVRNPGTVIDHRAVDPACGGCAIGERATTPETEHAQFPCAFATCAQRLFSCFNVDVELLGEKHGISLGGIEIGNLGVGCLVQQHETRPPPGLRNREVRAAAVAVARSDADPLSGHAHPPCRGQSS